MKQSALSIIPPKRLGRVWRGACGEAGGAEKIPTGRGGLASCWRTEKAKLKGAGYENPASLACGEAGDGLVSAVLVGDETADAQGGWEEGV